MANTCSIMGCIQPVSAKDYCGRHYMRFRRHGDPLRQPLTQSQIFWSSVDKTPTCWRWLGPTTNSGYGKFGIKSHLAHRFAWQEANGPTALPLDHLCMTKLCVRPDHLERVPQVENLRRADHHFGIRSAKTRCPHGHEYTAANTAHRNGRRHCRACERQRAQRNRDKKRESHAEQFRGQSD